MAASKWRLRVGSTIPVVGGTFSTANTTWLSASFGDDRNAGTEDAPVATLNRANVLAKTNVVASGYFYNNLGAGAFTRVFGDGMATFVYNIIPATALSVGNNAASWYNVGLQGYTTFQLSNGNQVAFSKVKVRAGVQFFGAGYTNSVIIINQDVTSTTFFLSAGLVFRNHTIIFNPGNTIQTTIGATQQLVNFLFYGTGNWGITSINLPKFTYYSYISNNIPIRLNGGTGTNEVTFTTVASIAALRARCVAVYGGLASDYFPNCYVGANPFNETTSNVYETIGDHSLNMTVGAGLIAASMADDFNYAGAYNVGVAWRAGVDYITPLTNLTLVGTGYQLTSTTLDGVARGIIKNFTRIRRLNRNFFTGVEAPLNGMFVDSTQNQGAPISPTGLTYNVLNPGSYVVVSGTGVVYNGNTYTVGQKFTTVGGVLTATDGDGTGQIRDITERPNKRNLKWRFSQGGVITAAITSLVNNDWVCVISGSIFDGSVTYSVGDIFKYNSSFSYTGTYTVQFIFNDSLAFKNYELSNANDVSVDGAAVANGEQAFNFPTETFVLARYAQPELVIESDNQRFLL